MTANEIKPNNKIHARSIFTDDIYDMASKANCSTLITDEEFALIYKALAQIDPLVGIKY